MVTKLELILTNSIGYHTKMFCFDYTCSVIDEETNPRIIRSFSRQVAKDFGFDNETGKKRNGNRGGKKKLKKE